MAPLSIRLVCFSGLIVLWIAAYVANADTPQEFLNRTKADTGHASTFVAMTSFIQENGATWSEENVNSAWSEWRKAQVPKISSENLASLMRSKRESISDLDVTYVRTWAQMGKETTRNKERLAFAGPQLYFKYGKPQPVAQTSMLDNTTDSEIWAFDGTLQQYLNVTPNYGEIQPFNSRQTYFKNAGPLAYAMLTDSKRDIGRRQYSQDIVALLEEGAIVQEVTEEINGRVCMVICMGQPPNFIAYLDPRMGYSVVKYEEYLHDYEDNGLVKSSLLRSSVLNSDFVDLGNDLWLPLRTVRTSFVAPYMFEQPEQYKLSNDTPLGSIYSETILDVELIRANEGVQDSLFTDVIPEGALTFDEVGELMYRKGAGASIESVLKEEILEGRKLLAKQPDHMQFDSGDGLSSQDQRSVLTQWFFVTALIACACAIAISIVIGKRKHHRNRGGES